MADVRKKIFIEGDAGGVVNAFNEMGNSGNAVYERLKKDAEDYSDNLKLQAQYIDRMIALEQKRANEYNKTVQEQLEVQKEDALTGSNDRREKFQIEREFEDKVEKAKRYALIEKQQLMEAKQLADAQYGDARFRNVRDFEDDEEEQVNPNDPKFRRMAQKTKQFMGAGAGAVMSGIGIGFALGFAGIMYEMVKSSNELDKGMANLRATMKGVDQSSLSAASSIGKTTAQMSEFTRNFAIQSGGEMGGLTGKRSLQLAQFSKAFGVDEQLLLGQLPTGRMGGADVNKELLDLLREMFRTGTVTNTNMSKLTEKIEYWSRLNEMQAQQMVNVAPETSTLLLGALEETDLPILSDQRQMDFLNKINQSIKQPGNEYVRAYNMSAFGEMTGGNVFEAMKLEEQGIFGKGVMRKLLEQWQRDFGDQRKDVAAIGMSTRFGLGLQESEMLMEGLFSDTPESKERLQKLLTAFDKIAVLNEDYSQARIEGDKDKKAQLEKDYNESAKQLKEQYGINVPGLAQDNTAISDAVIATYTNIMASNGSKVLESMGNLLMNPDILKSVDTITAGLSYAASEIIDLAAKGIAAAAKLFNETVKLFAEAVGFFKDRDTTKDVHGKDIPKNLQTSGYGWETPLLGNTFRTDISTSLTGLKLYYRQGYKQKEISEFLKDRLDSEGELKPKVDEDKVIKFYENMSRNQSGVSKISDLYGFQEVTSLPEKVRNEIKGFTSTRIKNGKIIDEEFDEYEYQRMKKMLEEIYLDYYHEDDANNSKKFGTDKYQQRLKEFKDLPIEAKSNKEVKDGKDTSAILIEPMRDLAKVLRDNVNELKRTNFAVPGTYTESYAG